MVVKAERTTSALLAPVDQSASQRTFLAGDLPAVAPSRRVDVVAVGKRFAQRWVVQNVTLALKSGEVVGLLGPNGAGKTTCFYLIAGLVMPDAGALLLDGKDITPLPMHKRARNGIGYLPQEASIFRGLTVEQNIDCVAERVEPNRRRRQAFVDELLAEFSLQHLRRARASMLSGGERRRVEVARSLASRPSFLLLDEPFAGIDPIAIADIRDLVRQLKLRGLGVLISDHNVRETLGVIDRGYVMHQGQLLSDGSPDTILADPRVRQVYLGERFKL